MTNSTSNITNMTEDQQQELLKRFLEKERKAKETAKRYRENNSEKVKVWSERARVRNLLLAQKAKERGIVVSEEEIDEYLTEK